MPPKYKLEPEADPPARILDQTRRARARRRHGRNRILPPRRPGSPLRQSRHSLGLPTRQARRSARRQRRRLEPTRDRSIMFFRGWTPKAWRPPARPIPANCCAVSAMISPACRPPSTQVQRVHRRDSRTSPNRDNGRHRRPARLSRHSANTSPGSGSMSRATPTPTAPTVPTPRPRAISPSPSPIATTSSTPSTHDKPYDQFIREQLAADLLGSTRTRPNSPRSDSSRSARTLKRAEDGIDDWIDLTTRGLMGVTVACARCHDHKYEPIPPRTTTRSMASSRRSSAPIPSTRNRRPLLAGYNPPSNLVADYEKKRAEGGSSPSKTRAPERPEGNNRSVAEKIMETDLAKLLIFHEGAPARTMVVART